MSEQFEIDAIAAECSFAELAEYLAVQYAVSGHSVVASIRTRDTIAGYPASAAGTSVDSGVGNFAVFRSFYEFRGVQVLHRYLAGRGTNQRD